MDGQEDGGLALRTLSVVALRFRSFPRARKQGQSPRPDAGHADLRRVNRVFVLGDDDTPGPNQFVWSDELPLAPGGPPVDVLVRAPTP